MPTTQLTNEASNPKRRCFIRPQQLPASIALLTGKEAQAEIIIERQDGSRVITAGSAKPISNSKGKLRRQLPFSKI